MQKKWKRTGAALLIAGLTVTGTSYAWADEKGFDPLDLRQLGKDTTTDVVENSTETVGLPKEKSVVKEDETNKKVKEDIATEDKATEDKATEDKTTVEEETVLPEIPEGYTAGNLDALGKAYEKVRNPTAKAAIKRNMELSIEKWENKQLETETELPDTKTTEQPEVKEETDKKEAPVKQDKPAKVKQDTAPQAELNALHKEQRQELKANQKAERKADKEQQKQVEKEKNN